LDQNSGNKNEQEKSIIEEILKYIKLIGFKFTSVNFIEDLKKDKHIEEDRIVFACLLVPLCDSN